MLQNVAEGILTVDEYGRIETCNPAAEEVFGFPHAELAGRPLGELVPMLCITSPADGISFGQMLAFAKFGSGPIETSGRRRDESIFPIEVSIGAEIPATWIVPESGAFRVESGWADSGAISNRLQGVLRSPTFVIQNPAIHFHVKGRGGRLR